MPGNPFHIRICAQDVANVHYVFNDKSPWEAKHCSMSFIASHFDQGIPKFALPRGNIQNCKAHLPLKRLNHHKSFQVIQNHTSHQHIITCINTPGLPLKSVNWTNLQLHTLSETEASDHTTIYHKDIHEEVTHIVYLRVWPWLLREVAWLLGLFVYVQETNQRTTLFSWFIMYFLYNAIHNSIIKRTWPFI